MNNVTPLLRQLPHNELNDVLCVAFWVSFKCGKLTFKEVFLNVLKIIRGLFLYTHFQMTKGK